MQYNSNILARKLPIIDDLVDMAMVISKKALHEFLLMKCKEQMIEFTKRFKFKENTPKKSKLKAELTTVINEEGSSEEILEEICCLG